MNIVLASKSKARQEILKKYITQLEIAEQQTEELKPTLSTARNGKNLKDFLLKNAKLKTQYLSKERPDDIILGYDTVVYCQGKIFGKPVDLEDAKKMLLEQRGNIEYICTGMCIMWLNKNIEIKDMSVSKVYFKYISNWDIEQLLKDPYILNCAAAYNIKLENDPYIDIYEGEIENIAGLPLRKTLYYLKKLNVI